MELLDKEKRFYDALGVAPEVPEGVLREVLRRTRRPSIFTRFALAACIALAFIIPGTALINIGAPAAVYADDYDLADEMFYAFEYVNGNYDSEFLFADNININP